MLSRSMDSAQGQHRLLEHESPEDNPSVRRGIRGLFAAIGLGLAAWMATAIAVVAMILN